MHTAGAAKGSSGWLDEKSEDMDISETAGAASGNMSVSLVMPAWRTAGGGPVENGGFQIMKSVYVGNLPYATTEAELRTLFEQHGKVFGAQIKTDRETGRPLGYGFVLLDDEEAPDVMQAMDGYNFEGRSLRVNESRERTQTNRNRFDGGGRSFRREREFNRDGKPERTQRRFERDGEEERHFTYKRKFNNDFSYGERQRKQFHYDEKRKQPPHRFRDNGRPGRDFSNDPNWEDRPSRRFNYDGNGERSFRPRYKFNHEYDGKMTERHRNYNDKRSGGFRRDFDRDDRQWKPRFNKYGNNSGNHDNDSE